MVRPWVRSLVGGRVRSTAASTAGAPAQPSDPVQRSVAWLALFAAAVPAAAPAAAQQGAPGFAVEGVGIAPAGAILGGFELLPGGSYAVFDGTSIVEVDPGDGSVVRTLFTPPTPVFGAFLTLAPSGASLFFGESSRYEIWEIDLATLQAEVRLMVPLPFDLAFDPQGRPFVSYATSFFNGSHVALVDFENGTWDDVVDSPDPSGPIVFDAAGDLYAATPDVSSWPPPPGSTEVWRVAAADVEAALGAGSFDVTTGTLLTTLDGVYGFALDAAGDLLASDPNAGVLVEIDPASGAKTLLAEAGAFTSFLQVRHVAGARGAYEPWQPGEAGTTHVVRSDFFSLNEVTRVAPARPGLATSVASPIPVGPFDLEATGGPAAGFALLFVCDGLLGGEFELRNRTAPAPLFFALDFVNTNAFPLLLDGNGEWRETLDNPGLGGLDLAAQLLVGATPAGPFFGTSEALAVTLQ